MKPYAELLEFNQPNPIRKDGFTRTRDAFPGLKEPMMFLINGIPDAKWFDAERIIEFAGRWDYGPNNAEKLGQESKAGGKMIKRWMDSGEQSMIEMAHATVFVECSRVVTHEFVRHRLASYQQESQRYTKYDEEDAEDLFYMPPQISAMVEVEGDEEYRKFMGSAKTFYTWLRQQKVGPQIARYVLPNATRTRMVISTNLREWRHIVKLRLHSSAQPEMRELVQQIYDQLIDVFPQSLEGVLEEGRGIR